MSMQPESRTPRSRISNFQPSFQRPHYDYLGECRRSLEGRPNAGWNARASMLHRLPLDIFLNLVDFLDPLDRACLRLASYAFASHIQPQALGDTFVLPYLIRLENDATIQLFWKQYNGSAPLSTTLPELVCSGCQKLHPRDAFTKTALKKPAHQRLCPGREKVIILPPGARHDFSTVNQAMLVPYFASGYGASDGLLNVPGQHDDAAPGRRFMPRPFFVTKNENRLMTWMRIPLVPLVDGNDETVPEVSVAEALSTIEDYICPHLSINSAQFMHSMFEYGSRQTEFGWVTGRDRAGSEGVFSSSVASFVMVGCPDQHCDTHVTITFSRIRGGEARYFCLDVWRDFGPVTNPMDPKWCAQLERW
ncbi:hypothetical protein EJ04DRAFT_607139 [Polyplosphaeria fusca]|uniref:F-box domain-containing protein n=1 Tax=Polyplosphaeria fusca TaxID=682080 RepID=A0A9P4QXK1_9PLEO|nr:hypothetical protein EJ04DRAFT_607139 [Polyplosphaeria fusca]